MKHIIFTSSEAILTTPERFKSYKGDKLVVNGLSYLVINDFVIFLEPWSKYFIASIPRREGNLVSFLISTEDTTELFSTYKRIKQVFNSELIPSNEKELSKLLLKEKEKNSELEEQKDSLIDEICSLAYKVDELERELKRARKACMKFRLKLKRR